MIPYKWTKGSESMEVHFPHIEDAVTNKAATNRRKMLNLRRLISYFILTSVFVSFIIFSQ